MNSRLTRGLDARRVPRTCHWRWPELSVLVVAVLFNAGCIMTTPGQWIRNGFKVGPNYGKPAAPVAEDWIQADDSSVQRQHVQEWWRVFGDPALDSLIVTAYEQNPTLRIAVRTGA